MMRCFLRLRQIAKNMEKLLVRNFCYFTMHVAAVNNRPKNAQLDVATQSSLKRAYFVAWIMTQPTIPMKITTTIEDVKEMTTMMSMTMKAMIKKMQVLLTEYDMMIQLYVSVASKAQIEVTVEWSKFLNKLVNQS